MRPRVAAATLIVLAATLPAVARVHLRRPARGYPIKMGAFTIPPAGEREVCEYRVLPNAKPMDVQAYQLDMTPGAHHFVLWAYLGKDRNADDFPKTIVDSPGCVGVGPRDSFFSNANLFGIQTPHVKIRFPRGVAVRLAAHQQVFLNAHLRNPSATDPLVPEVVFNLIPARKGTVKHHAQALVVGNMAGINVPPHGAQSLVSEWHAPIDLNVIQLSTHQHKRGTHAAIDLIDAAGNDKGRVFESDDWQHPGEYWANPAIRVAKGDGFRLLCEWANADDYPVRFGVTTNDEMCFLIGYFYPDDESQPIPQAGCLPQGEGLLCYAQTVS